MHNKQTKFIKTTMDGAVRLDQITTPAEFQGLYTDDLQTCIALIITGQKNNFFSRISLIHDGGYLSIKHILDELIWVASNSNEISLHINIILNLAKTKEADNGDHLMARIEEITGLGQQYLGRPFEVGVDCSVLDTSTGSVWVNRKGVISFTSLSENELQQPPELIKRNTINYFNNFFSSRDRVKNINLDLQFDGANFCNLPTINKSVREIAQLINTVSFSQNYEDQKFFSDFVATIRYPNHPQLFNCFKEYAVQEGIYSYTIPDINLIKEAIISERLGGFIYITYPNDDVKAMLSSQTLKQESRQILGIDRYKVTLNDQAKYHALTSNQDVTLEHTEVENKFLVTFPEREYEFVKNIVEGDKITNAEERSRKFIDKSTEDNQNIYGRG